VSRKGDRASETFASVRRRADAYERTGAYLPYHEAAVRDHEERGILGTGMRGESVSKIVLMAIGGGIGLVLLVLAALSFVTAGRWNEAVRDGATTGYLVIGVFLTAAGIAAIAGTWNHNFRVEGRRGGGH
jgi:hypothetical protein